MNRLLAIAVVGLGVTCVCMALGWQQAAQRLARDSESTALAVQRSEELEGLVTQLFSRLEADSRFDRSPVGQQLREDLLQAMGGYYREYIQRSAHHRMLPLAEAHVRLAQLARNAQDWPLVIEHLEAAKVAIHKPGVIEQDRIRTQQLMAESFYLLAEAHWAIGELRAALHASDRAMESQQRLMTELLTDSSSDGAVTSAEDQLASQLFGQMLIQRALIHRSLGELQTALEELRHAGEILDRVDSSPIGEQQIELDLQLSLISSQSSLAVELQQRGDAKEAQDLAKESLARATAVQQMHPDSALVGEAIAIAVNQVARLANPTSE